MKTFALTHAGWVRKKNEDRYLTRKITDGSILLAVADGMGGEAAGDYAAELIMKKLASVKTSNRDIRRQLSLLVKKADRSIVDEVKKNSVLEGMGSTITCALLRDGIVHWIHVGDSRLYVMNNRELIQITKDQNMAQFLLEEGEITAEEARFHPSRNQLDQCVGCGDCEPDMGYFEIEIGNLLVLTTDGLHEAITPENMSFILTSQTDIKTKAKSLIKTALEAGGKDNATIVIAEI